MAPPPSPNDLTRQQLDELDVLLQRMLALPLNKPEPAVPFPPPPPLPELPAAPSRFAPTGWRADVPEPSAKSPHLTPEPATLPMLRRVTVEPPAAIAPSPSPRIYTPSAPTPASEYLPPGGPGTLRGVDAPALPSDYAPRRLPPPDDEPPLPSVFGKMDLGDVNPFADLPPAKAPAPVVARESKGVPLPLWPVFAVNWVIEFVLGWFGPLGHLLTRPWVKTLLGWAGVLLLFGAGAWAAKGKGWVNWPRW